MDDDTTTTQTLSCLIRHEDELDLIINELLEKAVARHDISIQGDAHALNKKYGHNFVNPTLVQHSLNPPKKNPFLHDDFGWVLGFSFALPVVICVIIGVFFVGNLNDPSDNILYGVLGFIIGAGIGWAILNSVKRHRRANILQQEEKGGFILWIIAHNLEQKQIILDILNAHRAVNIEIHQHESKPWSKNL